MLCVYVIHLSPAPFFFSVAEGAVFPAISLVACAVQGKKKIPLSGLEPGSLG